MISCTKSGTNWAQTFDAENRLATVSDGTNPTTTYVYDGSSGRIMRRVGNTTTLYVMGMEIELTVDTTNHTHSWVKTTIYYPAGGAFRVYGGSQAGLYYRHGDHLGSSSAISNSSGALFDANNNSSPDDRVAYAPFGEMRVTSTSIALPTITDFGFTGQILDRSTGGSAGLMFYQSRYYLPELRRFISPDSIIPGETNPQAWNRYTYTLNSPLKYIDPDGHFPILPIIIAAAALLLAGCTSPTSPPPTPTKTPNPTASEATAVNTAAPPPTSESFPSPTATNTLRTPVDNAGFTNNEFADRKNSGIRSRDINSINVSYPVNVYAPVPDAKVIIVDTDGDNEDLGNFVGLRLDTKSLPTERNKWGEGFMYLGYAHLSEVSAVLDQIAGSDPIGMTGNTGIESEAIHLDLTAYFLSEAIDPLDMFHNDPLTGESYNQTFNSYYGIYGNYGGTEVDPKDLWPEMPFPQ